MELHDEAERGEGVRRNEKQNIIIIQADRNGHGWFPKHSCALAFNPSFTRTSCVTALRVRSAAVQEGKRELARVVRAAGQEFSTAFSQKV